MISRKTGEFLYSPLKILGSGNSDISNPPNFKSKSGKSSNSVSSLSFDVLVGNHIGTSLLCSRKSFLRHILRSTNFFFKSRLIANCSNLFRNGAVFNSSVVLLTDSRVSSEKLHSLMSSHSS